MTARMALLAAIGCFATIPGPVRGADDAPPKSLDPRLKVELFAEQPQIVTPTGIDVDHRGRVWVIESNTHHRGRREDYQGHDSDRVLIFSGRDEHGRAKDVTVFTDGLVHAMSIAVRPDGAVYVATRKEVLLYRDTDGDDKPDSRERILFLDTPGDYPHNGLAGFAFDALGWMYIGMGENLGAEYKLNGTDGSSFSGGGEGGNVFRCQPDGSKLTRFATGFWNPHASCFDTFGRMFTVDNDPDSRPPCRLLHTIRGGDYGYRYRNGRRGVHPFTSWNGELPGTLPMVAGTGEAPSGIVAYESDGFPEEYIGSLLVGSWGDHRIDRFQLKPRGTSFTSKAEPLIVGGENFRPVGLAVAPDGSLYFTDWVLKDYPVHGKGRIWRVSVVEEPQREVIDVATIPGRPVAELTELLGSKRVEVRRAAAMALAGTAEGQNAIAEFFADPKTPRRGKIEGVWALGRILSAKDFWSDVQNMSQGIDSSDGFGAEFKACYVVLGELNTSADQWKENTLIEPTGMKPLIENALATWESMDEFQHDRTIILAVLEWMASVKQATLPPEIEYTKIGAGFQKLDPFIVVKLLDVVRRSFSARLLYKLVTVDTTPQPEARLGFFLALRQKAPKLKSAAEAGLADPSPAIKRAAVQWIAEEDFQDLRPQLKTLLTDGDVSTDLFEATLAALAILDGVERDGDYHARIKDEIAGSQYVLQLVTDAEQSPQLRARALRTLAPADPGLNDELLAKLLAVGDAGLTLETVRTLQLSAAPSAARLLRSIARDDTLATDLRAEAVVGLAAHPIDPASRELLAELLSGADRTLQIEALRAIRKIPTGEFDTELNASLTDAMSPMLRKPDAELTDDDRDLAEQLVRTLKATGHDVPPKLEQRQTSRPGDLDGWNQVLQQPADAAAGRRVFFHSASAGCYRCHTVSGRGGRIGPELSKVAGALSREKLVQSIIEPSAEIAPQFAVWTFVLNSGKPHSGVILRQDQDGTLEIGTADGEIVTLDTAAIDERVAQKTSLMPGELVDQLTVREFRDLMAYLATLK